MDIKETLLDIYSDGGEWEDFEPHIDKVLTRIATLTALLREAGEALEGIDSEYYVGDYRRAADIQKRIQEAVG